MRALSLTCSSHIGILLARANRGNLFKFTSVARTSRQVHPFSSEPAKRLPVRYARVAFGWIGERREGTICRRLLNSANAWWSAVRLLESYFYTLCGTLELSSWQTLTHTNHPPRNRWTLDSALLPGKEQSSSFPSGEEGTSRLNLRSIATTTINLISARAVDVKNRRRNRDVRNRRAGRQLRFSTIPLGGR